jgi:putative membrane protein
MKKSQKLLNLTLITGLALSPLSVSALQKTETVYSNLNSDGTPYKTVVSSHLSWIDDGDIEDDSELKDILNINGEEEFTQKDNKLSWKSIGKDIFYQGKTEKQQPIKTEIKYFLNEEEKTPEEMLGKEGNVRIEFTFQNQLKNIVRVNGINTEIYTPFVTTVGTMIDGNNNKNIKITNGKVISTGTRNMIIGLASPGLYESIGLKELKDLNKITLNYETTSFSMNSIYIVSTPKLLEETDLKIFDQMDALYNNMQELQKNMDKLELGINELEKGTTSLSTGTKELVNGIKNATNALEQLKNGATSLDNGLKQILLSLENAQNELTKMNLGDSLTKLTTLKTQNSNTINTLISKTNMSLEKLTNLYSQNNLSTYEGNDSTLSSIKSTYELIYLLQMNNQAIDTTLTTLKNVNNQLNSLMTTLKQAISTTSKGASSLSNGLTELKAGLNKIYNGSISLNQGANDLNKGANTLKNGASEFNKQGIQKLNRTVKTIKNYTNKIEALLNLSENYKGFTSQNSNTTNFVSTVKSVKVNYKR